MRGKERTLFLILASKRPRRQGSTIHIDPVLCSWISWLHISFFPPRSSLLPVLQKSQSQVKGSHGSLHHSWHPSWGVSWLYLLILLHPNPKMLPQLWRQMRRQGIPRWSGLLGVTEAPGYNCEFPPLHLRCVIISAHLQHTHSVMRTDGKRVPSQTTLGAIS